MKKIDKRNVFALIAAVITLSSVGNSYKKNKDNKYLLEEVDTLESVVEYYKNELESESNNRIEEEENNQRLERDNEKLESDNERLEKEINNNLERGNDIIFNLSMLNSHNDYIVNKYFKENKEFNVNDLYVLTVNEEETHKYIAFKAIKAIPGYFKKEYESSFEDLPVDMDKLQINGYSNRYYNVLNGQILGAEVDIKAYDDNYYIEYEWLNFVKFNGENIETGKRKVYDRKDRKETEYSKEASLNGEVSSEKLNDIINSETISIEEIKELEIELNQEYKKTYNN